MRVVLDALDALDALDELPNFDGSPPDVSTPRPGPLAAIGILDRECGYDHPIRVTVSVSGSAERARVGIETQYNRYTADRRRALFAAALVLIDELRNEQEG